MEVTIKINLGEMLREDDLRQLLEKSRRDKVELGDVVVRALEETARKSRESTGHTTEPVAA